MKFPSDFMKHPYDSILQNTESEIVARNIMVILKRTGNQWRELSFEEYKAERIKDGDFSGLEEELFHKVIPFCNSQESAEKFCKNW